MKGHDKRDSVVSESHPLQYSTTQLQMPSNSMTQHRSENENNTAKHDLKEQ